MTSLPKHVRVKTAKGRTYYYFDTGTVTDLGKPILKRLPDPRDPNFGRMLAAQQGARTRRGHVAHVLTLTSLSNLYEKSPKFRELAPASQTLYALYLKRACELCGIAPADDLRSQDVRIVRDRMAATPGAANAMVRALGALYEWGRKAGHVTARPTDGLEELKQGEHAPWPQWLIDQALTADDELVRRAVALLYYTGQRIGDVCQMRRSDARHGRIELTQQKTGKALVIPIHRELEAILGETKGLLLLSGPDGAPLRRDTLRLRIQAWAEAHGAHIVPHGLRKNAVMALLEAGCSTAETAAISGQTLQMIEHYAKLRDQSHLASAAILRWESAGNKAGQSKGGKA